MARLRAGCAILLVLSSHRGAQAHEIVPPEPIDHPAPSWPNEKIGTHDVVVPVVLTVTTEGRVAEVQIDASIGADFDAQAIEAAKRWTFRPAQSEGQPVSAKIRALVRFIGDPSQTIPFGSDTAPGQRSTREETAVVTATDRAIPAPIATPSPTPTAAAARETNAEVEVLGNKTTPPRSASETWRTQAEIQSAPHRTGGDLLQLVPGAFITQHSGQGKAYQVFYRGFDAVHGQDIEFWVGGAPVNEISNVHGQGYADLHFVMPEVVSRIAILPGNYSPDQGDFAVAGTIRYDLGYSEPGITAKATAGAFGERRGFIAYHPRDSSPESFAAFEAQSTDGFGPGRAAQRTSGVAQHVLRVGDGKLRWLATGYAARFDSPGVVRLAEIDEGKLGRFETYGASQGGFSSRYQFVGEYSGNSAGSAWSMASYLVLRGLELKQNYTGYLLDERNGDTTQLTNESTSLGVNGRYRYPIRWLSRRDSIEAGISVRNDWVSQSQLGVDEAGSDVISRVVDAKIRALDAAGWLDLAVSPISRLKIRAGLRVDGLAYAVRDDVPPTDGHASANASASPVPSDSTGLGGQVRSAMGTHFGPRVTLDGALAPGLHGIASYGEGFRSPQARSLGDGEKAPFTTVQSMEVGLRYVTTSINASVAVFRTALTDDLVFDAATTRNEAVPSSRRLGGALEFLIKPTTWFLSSGSATYTRATFTGSDTRYDVGDKLPYVPELVVRQDIAFTPRLGRVWSRPLTGRFGAALTGMFRRPQPYGTFGHDVFLLDSVTEIRLESVALGIDVFNLLDARWYDAEFTYSANWNRGEVARLVPERYVTIGSPRALLTTLTLFVD
jgi:TonB family protein